MKIRHLTAAAALVFASFGTAAIAAATEPVHEEKPVVLNDVEHDEHGVAEHGPGEHGEAERTAHGEHHAPEAVNWTDISDKKRPAILALLINFGILATLYYSLAKKPVAEGLKERRVKIGKDIDEAQKALADAQERAKKYQGDLQNADKDAETARSALVASGQGDADKLLREANERAERMKRDAAKLVEQERKGVHQELQGEAVELALVEAQKLLERAVTPEDHARLANDLLAELSRRPAATSSVTRGAA